MPGIVSNLGIDENNDGETNIRGIDIPQLGDDYQLSYYQILEAIEKNTVYFREDANDLPEPSSPYDNLIGIAPSTTDKIDANTVHMYDGSSWTDTATAVVDLINTIEQRLSDLETYTSLENYDDLQSLADQVDTNETNISDIDDQIGDKDLSTVKSNIDTKLRNATGDYYVDNDVTVKDDVDDFDTLLEDTLGSNYIDNDPDTVDSRLDTLESDIDSIYDDICPDN